MRMFNLNANGSTPIIAPTNLNANGSTLELFVTGTFGGGSVIVEQSPDGVNWFSVGTAVTARSRTTISIFSGSRLRITLSGATAPSLTVWIGGNGL